MKAEINIECKDPKTVIKALKPDIEETKKFDVQLETDENKIRLIIKSDDIPGLLAGINSYMRLIRTSISSMEV